MQTDPHHDRRPPRRRGDCCSRRRSSRLRVRRLRMQYRPAGRRRSRCPDRLSPAPSDHDPGSRPYARSFHRLQSRRAESDAARASARVRRWTGSAKPPAASSSSCRSAAPTSTPPPTRCARSSRSSPPAACRRRASSCAPIGAAGSNLRHRSHQLSENRRAGRTVRPVARGYRAELEPRTISKISRPGTSAAPPNAISPPMVDNPSDLVQPRARNPSLHDAAHHGAREISRRRKHRDDGYPASAIAAKISDVGK